MRFMWVVVAAAAAIALAGCNTVAGIGKDVEKAGDKIEKAAERHETRSARCSMNCARSSTRS
jgi:predicted small secreted protein